MNKAEWDAMERVDKHLMILEKVYAFPTEMIESYREDAKHGPGRGIFQPPRPYTTDRNKCALVLDELEKRDLMNEWWQCLVPLLDIPLVEWVALRTDPDTICYCAIKVVENG